ncbi:MAG TPA: Crp/Fnr family transcriptional regulator [Geminicoccaceae bacterium]|nr:Crp/Fnr family transcriptional regulator [Geminicoccaceae bacterium]
MSEDRQSRIRDALSDSDVFGALTDEELDRLIGYGNTVPYPRGRIIFQRGDPGDSLMVVLSGRVKISNMSLDGREAVLNFVEPGRTFGEIAIFDGKTRSADATTMEPTELFVLRRTDMIEFIERHPEVTFRVIGMLCERLRRTTEMMEESVLLHMAPRVAKGLLRLASQYGRRQGSRIRIELKLSQRELGGYVGLARENINRQLGIWRGERLISMQDGYITIEDPDRLRHIAEETS